MRSTISAALALSLALAGCGDVTPTSVASDMDPVMSVAANGDLHAFALLTGAQEVPPVETSAHGKARFGLNDDGTELSYRLQVAGIEDVLQAHIHLGPAGSNGPVVAFLFGPVAGGGGAFNGVLAEGTITADDLIGPLAGQPLSALVAAIVAGDTYVNVHTVSHPPGEIRGQIFAGGSNFASFFDLGGGFGLADAVVFSKLLDGNALGAAAARESLFTPPLAEWLGGSPVNADVVHVGRGCPDAPFPAGVPGGDTYLADPSGHIALIDRGACGFSSKIQRAYMAGAVGVIMANNVPGEVLLLMGALDPITQCGGDTSVCPLTVPIPAVLVTQSTGALLATDVDKGKIQAGSFTLLRDGVQGLISDGVLHRRQAGSLKDKLSEASDAVEGGDLELAIPPLLAFQQEVVELFFDPDVPLSVDDLVGLLNLADILIASLSEAISGALTS